MIAFDSNIVIYAMAGHAEFGQAAKSVLLQASSEGGRASTLLLGEVLCKADSAKKAEILLAESFLLKTKNIQYIPVTQDIATKAAALIRQHHGVLRLTDAIHLVSAQISGAKVFWTNDKKLAGVKLNNLQVKLLDGQS